MSVDSIPAPYRQGDVSARKRYSMTPNGLDNLLSESSYERNELYEITAFQ